MARDKDNAIMRAIRDFVATLQSSQLLMLLSLVFLLDLVIPDALPFVDEIILFILTLLVARWKSRERAPAADERAKPPPKDVTPRATRKS